MRNVIFMLFVFSFICCKPKTILVLGQQFGVNDSLILENYKRKIMRSYVEDSILSNAQFDTLWFKEYSNNNRFQNLAVKYSLDRKFKIFTIELESCGAYCNSEWFSWIHYTRGNEEIIKEVAFYNIDTIIQLIDNKYLIIDEYTERPASVYTIFCQNANLISFSDSLISHKINYRKEDRFNYCQQNSVELENESQPYIKYENGFLKYYYGNNYAYSDSVDVDTIRKGQFKYVRGEFILDKEDVKN